jgi:hypothetical protein
MLLFHKSQNMQQAINWNIIFVIDHPVFIFDVHILKQVVIYKDIFLRTPDIPYSLPLLI